jgi:hypothetical protein
MKFKAKVISINAEHSIRIGHELPSIIRKTVVMKSCGEFEATIPILPDNPIQIGDVFEFEIKRTGNRDVVPEGAERGSDQVREFKG